MASIPEIRQNRLDKIELLKKKGIDSYPISSKYDVTLKEAIEDFDALSEKKEQLRLVGRIISLRLQGAIGFFNFTDGTATFQGFLKKGDTPDELFDLFGETVDIGDFVEIEGTLFLTKTNQKTILVLNWKMLAKSLRPLPEKWHGLQDVEERFRRRYVDALMAPEVKERFILRSKLITEMRRILDDSGYLEVETPALQPIYGGASAEPFVTHHNALDIDLYLRISDELYLKRMLVAGFPKVYEISKDFRNEGIDVTHNPEFTMLEFYESFSNAEKQMAFVEKMFKTLVKKLFDSETLAWNEQEIDFSKEFTVISYFDLLKKYALISNPENATIEDLKSKAVELGVPIANGDSYYKIMDNIYKKACRPKLIQPTFIVDYPLDYLPLAKKKEGNDKVVDAFQLVIGSIELVKAFSELNDPVDQRERFKNQEKIKKEGEADAQVSDEDFLEAMEHGMPPAGGVGIGIDRLMMLLADVRNIKEVIFFPTMKPRE